MDADGQREADQASDAAGWQAMYLASGRRGRLLTLCKSGG
jgi:hypothetical protein